MNKISLSLVLGVLLSCSCSAAGQSSIEEIETQRMNVVRLRSHPTDRPAETGAGVYVGKDQQNAFFITAFHYLKKETDIDDPVEVVDLQFYAGPTSFSAKVLGRFDSTSDLAVVYIPVTDLPSGTAPMGRKDPTAELPIHIIGHPSAGDWTSWTGRVQNEISVGGQSQFFSTGADQSLTKGFSGGPVFDSHGNFIGMHISSAVSFAKNVKSELIVGILKAWQVPITNLDGPSQPTSTTQNATTPTTTQDSEEASRAAEMERCYAVAQASCMHDCIYKYNNSDKTCRQKLCSRETNLAYWNRICTRDLERGKHY
jgi:hypothetical protein